MREDARQRLKGDHFRRGNEYTRWYRAEKVVRRVVGQEAGSVEEWMAGRGAPCAMLEGWREPEKDSKQLKNMFR